MDGPRRKRVRAGGCSKLHPLGTAQRAADKNTPQAEPQYDGDMAGA